MKSILNNIILSLIILIAVGVALNGCEVNHALDPEEYGKIYMPQAREQPAERPLIMADTAQTIVYGAAYGGPGSPGSEISVNFSVEPSLVDSFNTQNLTSYSILPEDSYELEQLSTTIPAGEMSTRPLELKVETVGAIQPITGYLLPVRMEKTSGNIEVNTDLQTTYFLVQGSFEEFDQSGWEIHDVDSEEPTNPPRISAAESAIDDDPATCWITKFRGGADPLPHHISIDMGESKNIHGFRILGRQNQNWGDPVDIDVEVSDDGETWENGESFTLPFNNNGIDNETTIYLSNTRNGRYFKITVNSTVDNPPWVTVAEIYAF